MQEIGQNLGHSLKLMLMWLSRKLALGMGMDHSVIIRMVLLEFVWYQPYNGRV